MVLYIGIPSQYISFNSLLLKNKTRNLNIRSSSPLYSLNIKAIKLLIP